PQRPDEEKGKEFYFVSLKAFKEYIARNQLIEHALYNGHYYGTGRYMLDASLVRHQVVIGTIDVQGCEQLLANKKGIKPIIIPLLLERREELEIRLLSGPGAIRIHLQERLDQAEKEYEAIMSGEFGEPIVNGHSGLERTVGIIQARIEASLR